MGGIWAGIAADWQRFRGSQRQDPHAYPGLPQSRLDGFDERTHVAKRRMPVVLRIAGLPDTDDVLARNVASPMQIRPRMPTSTRRCEDLREPWP